MTRGPAKRDSPPEGVSIIIPAYNEENSISEVVQGISTVMGGTGLTYEIIVVNDGSSDQTASKAASSSIRLISHEQNMGYGRALKSGIEEAQYEIVVITDADGTYPSDTIPKLLNQMEGHDMVVGARTGENVEIPTFRKPAKWVLNQLANYLSGRKIPDLNSGFRSMRKEAVLPFFHFLPDGFSFTATITIAMLTNGFRVRYIQIDYAKRHGKSKFRPIHDTLNYLQLVIRTVLYFNPLKIFLPASGLLIFMSLLLILYRLFIAKAFAVTAVLLFVSGIQLLALGMVADLINKRVR